MRRRNVWRNTVFFHRAIETVRIEMICRNFKHFSQKHAHNFVPLLYQPENNDIPVKTPPTGFDALRTIAVSRIYLDNPESFRGWRRWR